jgi:hypothetical protein
MREILFHFLTYLSLIICFSGSVYVNCLLVKSNLPIRAVVVLTCGVFITFMFVQLWLISNLEVGVK